jgi:inorganic pyrophosphatase
VVSERPISRAEVILKARVVGGLPMLDGGEADDKIIAVLDNDYLWSEIQDVSELPMALVDRLRHYFMTYKLMPNEQDHEVTIGPTYGREHAEKVIRASMEDYEHEFGG